MKEQGFCKFCGQSFMINSDDIPEQWIREGREDPENELATRRCTCDKAKAYTKIESSKEAVTEQIRMLFEKDHQEMGKIMIDAIDPIAMNKVKSVTVKAGEETVISAKISRTGDGTIKMIRQDTATAVAEG